MKQIGITVKSVPLMPGQGPRANVVEHHQSVGRELVWKGYVVRNPNHEHIGYADTHVDALHLAAAFNAGALYAIKQGWSGKETGKEQE